MLAPLAAALVSPAWAAQAPPAAGEGWSHADSTGDVRPIDPGATPQGMGASAVADLVDIRELRFHKETGIDFEILYGLQSLELALPQGRIGVLHMICFQAGGAVLGVRATYSYDDAGLPQSLFATLIRLPSTSCDPGANGPGPQLDALLDLETDALRFLVPKTAIVEHLGASASLAMGDTVAGIQALSRTVQAGGTAYFLMTDAAPDAGPSADGFDLRYHIHNRDLRVSAPTASARGVLQCSGLHRPVIAVEGGRYQGIPVLVENLLSTPVAPTLSTVVDPPSWQAKIIPTIELPGAPAEGGTANVTLTLIVKSPEAAGKSCAEVRVLAMDPSDHARMGELVLDVVSAPTPSAEDPTLYLHTRPDTQRPPRIWINAAPEDPTAQQDMAVRLVPVQGAQVGSSSVVQLEALGDGVYPFDLMLDATGTARANLFLRSDPVPTPARIVLELTSGGQRLAGGEAEVEIPTGGQAVPIDMLVDPDVWKAPQRRAPAEQPFGLVIRYEPTGRVPTVRGQGSGYVDFVPGQSSIQLPIVDRVLAKDVRLGSAGGLVSLSLSGPADALTNEARGTYFNFSLTNEGVAVDSFTLDVNVTSQPALDWAVEALPGAQLDRIAPGGRGHVGLLVRAPDVAPEAAEARLRVTVAGTNDDAQATSLVTVRVAKQQEHGVLLEAPVVTAQDTPAPAWALAALALAAAATAMRRR